MGLDFHFDNEKDINMSSKIYKESDHNVGLEWLTISCIDCVFHILGEVG